MEIEKSILTNNPCYKAGKKIAVKGLMIHSVGCPQPSAEGFIKKWNNADYKRACIHAFIDGNTGKVFQTLPWDYRGWHCGGSGNNTHIGVEMCEPACLKYTGGATFTCSDKQAAMQVVNRTYQTAVELFAFLCREFGLDPLADGVIVSHKEGHDRGIASGHGDPDHLWKQLDTGYTMDTFRKAIKEVMEGMPAGAFSGTKQQNTEGTGQQDTSGAKAGDAVCKAAATVGSICVGSIVKLLPNAVYYSGKEMPSWVKDEQWIVKSVSGDRVVIDKNVSGTRSICSPVSMQYLTVTDNAAKPDGNATDGITDKKQETVQAPSAGTERTVSAKGVELVAKYEGCKLAAYKCPAGVWTIGYGHTANVKEGDTLASAEAAKALLTEDLKKYAGYVNTCIRQGLITFPVNQNQFDALTSFVYNCGNGSLQKLVSGRDAATVAEKILAYNKGGGKVLAGLVKRREEERALFLS